MFTVPADTPETIPEIEPTVATSVLPLVQVPGVTISDNVVVVPTHKDSTPDTGSGVGLTVTSAVT